ncbi:Uncharacterized conserved protein YbjT, contains NAD(P)-binding and DUF2867 domains [Mesorhizobium albiziae]|uniref:Uncharacterized conserved protein YbjT, contains NAD(P)-binding and DUF2867 domains n=1 Tax=Neomesorhizobium albiziae TaxID=335020 RepID=A0A1I4BZ78_9HYPH|nr:NmrA family NAD(P)-binding protein [Mesorhizobium albiziae]GLS29586.1 NmrA family transcriptional regulator [Mesorhizobium albiziae]SFK74104.1 Uncharacterized conserved protein YbjT, contains NAD(P)-binding and DUF2867 domains [Mesorhizobium albiziae]
MHIVLGGTGHVGSAVARSLLAQGEPVTVVTRKAALAEALRKLGAGVAEADVHDVDCLRAVLRGGRKLFLLNPPADVSTDTDAAEKKSIAAIVSALEGSGLEQVVAESTYGAQPGYRLGDLNTLFELEEALKRQPISAHIIRAAYYMSNWEMSVETARAQGVLQTMLPTDLVLPMVAPEDIGGVAAELLTRPAGHTGTTYVEGPRRYSPRDVADAFAAALGKPVTLDVTPRTEWEKTFRAMGFSAAAAESYARMTAITVGSAFMPADPRRGPTTLENYVAELVG